VDDVVPVHFEVLLPAFVLGCVIAHGREAHDHDIGGARASAVVSAAFMLLVGLSMPVMGGSDPSGEAWPGWGTIALHTLALTVLANLGKMVPLLCYRREVGWHDRLALCIGMWPRGEVGAGVLVVSLAYGISGARVTAATLCLALNLLCTGLFIIGVKRLIASGSTAIRM
jgi:Kef-type K+ transport system membrane component KefB